MWANRTGCNDAKTDKTVYTIRKYMDSFENHYFSVTDFPPFWPYETENAFPKYNG